MSIRRLLDILGRFADRCKDLALASCSSLRESSNSFASTSSLKRTVTSLAVRSVPLSI